MLPSPGAPEFQDKEMWNLLGLQLAVPQSSHGGPVGGSPCVPSLSPVCLDCATPGCLLAEALRSGPWLLWTRAGVEGGGDSAVPS